MHSPSLSKPLVKRAEICLEGVSQSSFQIPGKKASIKKLDSSSIKNRAKIPSKTWCEADVKDSVGHQVVSSGNISPKCTSTILKESFDNNLKILLKELDEYQMMLVKNVKVTDRTIKSDEEGKYLERFNILLENLNMNKRVSTNSIQSNQENLARQEMWSQISIWLNPLKNSKTETKYPGKFSKLMENLDLFDKSVFWNIVWKIRGALPHENYDIQKMFKLLMKNLKNSESIEIEDVLEGIQYVDLMYAKQESRFNKPAKTW